MRIQQVVQDLCSKHETVDPFELCSALDITVLRVDLPQGVNGFYLTIQDCAFIFLNEQMEEAQSRMICAHELGHALLHPTMNSQFMQESTNFVIQRYEREADEFCAHLLLQELPEELRGLESVTRADICAVTGLPEKIVKLRFS